ncbi:MAG: methyl-accepting chemotaxis protein [Aquitalea sp.]|nr:methyl-accepting chemotaxis protein [Aquitalea sp.]
MRNNQPVTAQETLIPENTFIYSRTDLQGNITEANSAFATISGYQQEEMVGQPHNMIRHPDMPEAAFADMWACLKAGMPWKGIVKNRRKDGGFYWVCANASPIREDGRIIGYQSVRTRPTTEQKESAAKAYQRIRQGDNSIRIQHGRVVKNNSKLRDTLTGTPFLLNCSAILCIVTIVLGLLNNVAGVQLPSGLYLLFAVPALMLAAYTLLLRLPETWRRLQTVHDFVQRIMLTGDLCAQLTPTRNDIIGVTAGMLDTQTSAMRATVQVMQDTARNVDSTTVALNDSVVALAASTTRQTEKTTASAAAVEELAASIGLIAQNAIETESVTVSVGERAKEAAQLSDKASETIRELAQTVNSSAETVEQLGRRTEEIGKVASVIKDIADQTNLLALNAAIEAARAGETGRGFAVVADEVRKLAERTATATQEIDKMISRIQVETAGSVSGMRQSANQVGMSVDLVHQAHQVLSDISVQMQQTLSMMADITHSSREQKVAMDSMGQSLEEMARLTEKNQGVANDTEGASTRLGRNVKRMGKTVAQYIV